MTRRGFLASIAALIAGRAVPQIPGPVWDPRGCFGPYPACHRLPRGGILTISDGSRTFDLHYTSGEMVAETSWAVVVASPPGDRCTA